MARFIRALWFNKKDASTSLSPLASDHAGVSLRRGE
jgi:hypothetical protein